MTHSTARALLLILSLGRQAGVYGLNTTEVCPVKLSAALFLLLGVMPFASGDEPTVSLRKNEATRTGGATTLEFAFEGVRFKKQPDGTLKVMMVSGPVQFEFPQSVKQSELVSGAKIPLSGQATRAKGFSSATMKIQIKIYFDSDTGQLQIIEANGDVSVQLPIGRPFTDPDELPEVIYGKKASVVSKPTVTLVPIEKS